MFEHEDHAHVQGEQRGVDRRQLLRGGAAAGAVVWATPVVQALSVGVAAADSPSGTVPPPPPPPPTSPPTSPPTPPRAELEGYPSHGLALFSTAVAGDKPFAVKIDSGSANRLTGVNEADGKQDAGQLDTQYGAGKWRQPTAAELSRFTSFGKAVNTEVSPTQDGLYIDAPGEFAFLEGYAFTFDGSFGPSGKKDAGCGDGDKYTNAFVTKGRVWFLVRCNEPSTGE